MYKLQALYNVCFQLTAITNDKKLRLVFYIQSYIIDRK